MTAIEFNAEIYRRLRYLSGNENYLRKTMNELKRLVMQMRRESDKAATQKIKVKEMSLSTNKYIGICHRHFP